MNQLLPDIARLTELSLTTWSEFGKRLRDCALDAQLQSELWPNGLKIYEALARPIVVSNARNRPERSALAYRMFCLDDPVTEQEAIRVIGHTLLAAFLDAGLLVRLSTCEVVSPFELKLFQGLYILCDDLRHKGDAVFGIGPGTSAFTSLGYRLPHVRNALDLGCGAGAVALWLAKRIDQVLATDINPRALTFLQANAAINNILNLEFSEGDLYRSVSNKTFDLVLSQPPFVPKPVDANPEAYRFGGPLGNEIALQIIRDTPTYLTTRGFAMIVFEQPVQRGVELTETGDNLNTLSNGDMRTLLLLGDEVDADAYSIRYASRELRIGIPEFGNHVTEMREHLKLKNIHGVRPAICIIESFPNDCNWVDTVCAGRDLWKEISSGAIERLLRGLDLVHRPIEGNSRDYLYVPTESIVIHPLRPEQGSNYGKIVVALPAGYLPRTLEVTYEEWEQLLDLANIDDRFICDASKNTKSVVDPAFANHVISKALRAGLVRVPCTSQT
jgi:SAM-dependent methyltransferase